MNLSRVHVVDSHTGGEPTRTVISGGPDLGDGPLAERLTRFGLEHNDFRNSIINEPRGSDVLVGALLVEPVDPTCVTGVLYFNNVGNILMCGHGTIGVVATLAYLGRITPGTHRIETAVGIVSACLHPDMTVTLANVPSFRIAAGVTVDVPGYGPVTGDIAWGGNWFFLVANPPFRLVPSEIPQLTTFTTAIKRALAANNITGNDSGEIDHIELFVDSDKSGIDSRNFVLCPGGAYDRSPCGTGTSAKLACLYADGKLLPGGVWRQESIIGSVFEGRVTVTESGLIPSITGRAFVNSDAQLIYDPADPFRLGIPTA
ncbi:proline racemase family protein [Granulicella sibirica]|uniref:4-hydroxyproline epimerase n=1 Tax=Granulicella sibirica TaxID=2479048 RepID=A0A4Q0STP5_9BACT|nr:proline racemase family protein [Granulicella sibirica]RXH54365.1 4-hydroxyproline epimerase [Granulicella sibirica]